MKYIFTFLALSIIYNISAQSNYTFSVLNEPYQPLENPISLSNGEVWDDPAYTIPVGFDFLIGQDLLVNTLFIPEDLFGGTISNESVIDADGSYAILGGTFLDIVSLINSNGDSVSSISYQLEGDEGNRILKMEWDNVGFFDDITDEDFMSFQVWLYETTNTIEYRYGNSQIENPEDSYEGLTGQVVGLFPLIQDDGNVIEFSYFLTGDASNPTVVNIPPGTQLDETPSIDGTPPLGTVYRFSYEALSLDEFSEASFVFYPNPVSDHFIVQTQLSDFTVSIYNHLGQKISDLDPKEGHYYISNLSAGIYFLKIKSNNMFYTKKIIKK